MSIMKAFIKRMLMLLCMMAPVSCGVQKTAIPNTASGDEFIEYEGLTDKGECIITATGRGGDSSGAAYTVQEKVVQAILFSGINGNEANRVKSLAPMISDKDALTTHSDYFKSFFSPSGLYAKFIKPMPGVLPKTVRTKGGYKVTNTYIVDKNALRKELEGKGIIKSLSNVLQ